MAKKYRVLHDCVGAFSKDQEITDEQIAAAAKANHVTFDVDGWLKAEAVAEVQPTPEEVKAAEEQKATAAKAATEAKKAADAQSQQQSAGQPGQPLK